MIKNATIYLALMFTGKKCRGIAILLLLTALFSFSATAQVDKLRNLSGRFGGGGGGLSGKGGDSLKHRTGLEDSITINFRYLDTSRYDRFDSSINDITRRTPIPADYIYLGNVGTAAKSIHFTPNMQSGWDAGFHAYDVYKLKFRDTRFFNTTRPYTELGYLFGSRAEQQVNLLHTQNVTPDWNIAFQYKLINSPGFFKNQNTNHGSYRFNTFYRSKNRRYNLFFIWLGNKIQASENGGIQNDQNYIDSIKTFRERSTIPVQLGDYVQPGLSPFNSRITTGTKQKNVSFLLRQQYDFGKKDSLVTDSNVVHLFYPKLRGEHTIQYSSYIYSFVDQQPDTAFYRYKYDFLSTPAANLLIQERWKELINDFSLYSFPDAKNPQQFLKVGASLQNLSATMDAGNRKYYNLFLHGEYRNKTRNKKWDIEATGKLYVNGLNSGDYNAVASLKRYISKSVGYLQLGFENTNRTPSFIFSGDGSFSIGPQPSFNKENITHLFASLEQPKYNAKLFGSYYLVTNYTYFKDYYHADQHTSPFNVLQITGEKDFRLRKHLVWHASLTVQQRIGNGPVNIPLVNTRHRIGYEGSLGFPNLLMNTGFEIKYHTPYKADGYSPLLGQFYYQDAQTISLAMPEINAYMHFRIRSFTAYVRLDNLNTMRFTDGFGFTNNNLAAANYPYPGLQFRVGIFWSFVN